MLFWRDFPRNPKTAVGIPGKYITLPTMGGHTSEKNPLQLQVTFSLQLQLRVGHAKPGENLTASFSRCNEWRQETVKAPQLKLSPLGGVGFWNIIISIKSYQIPIQVKEMLSRSFCFAKKCEWYIMPSSKLANLTSTITQHHFRSFLVLKSGMHLFHLN